MALRIGLMGGIGSGKSTAAAMLSALGAEVLDSDEIAHSLTAPGGAALAALAAQFGPEALADDGALDFARMRGRVFADPAAARRFEAIVQPLVKEEILRRAAASRAGCVVLVVPHLSEAGRTALGIERLVRVECPAAIRAGRIARRAGIAPQEARRIVAAQAQREAQLARADDTLDNSGDTKALRRQVAALHARWAKYLP